MVTLILERNMSDQRWGQGAAEREFVAWSDFVPEFRVPLPQKMKPPWEVNWEVSPSDLCSSFEIAVFRFVERVDDYCGRYVQVA